MPELGHLVHAWRELQQKFTRSPPTVPFVKDGKRFTFNDKAVRVPSARQLRVRGFAGEP